MISNYNLWRLSTVTHYILNVIPLTLTLTVTVTMTFNIQSQKIEKYMLFLFFLPKNEFFFVENSKNAISYTKYCELKTFVETDAFFYNFDRPYAVDRCLKWISRQKLGGDRLIKSRCEGVFIGIKAILHAKCDL